MQTKRAMILVSNDPESIRLGANELIQHLNEALAAYDLQDEVEIATLSNVGSLQCSPAGGCLSGSNCLRTCESGRCPLPGGGTSLQGTHRHRPGCSTQAIERSHRLAARPQGIQPRRAAHCVGTRRSHRPGEHRRVHRRERLSGARQSPDRNDARAGDRDDREIRPAGTRRRRLPHRAQVEIRPHGEGRQEIRRLQRG